MKILKILFIIFNLFIFKFVFALSTPVDQVFTDIESDYKYYNELQYLYDNKAISQNKNEKFDPYRLLTRDEFVWITLEVSCKTCTIPNTPIDLIEAYSSSNNFFDVTKSNKYFYCIASSDQNWDIKWYDKWYTCDNWVSKILERPFCPSNNITLEEAIAVILRNSNIFSVSDNVSVMNDIKEGKITKNISSDVSAKNTDWSPNTFYWYLRKALDYKIVEYDNLWNKKEYILLKLEDWKIHPKRLVRQEDFLIMSYIALKTNSCSDNKNEKQENIAVNIWIFDKSCKSYTDDCSPSELNSNEKIYDFKAFDWWVCESWILEKEGYVWKFHNKSTNELIIKYWKYIDNYDFLTNWKWTIYLNIKDKCWNVWEVYNTLVVWKNNTVENKDSNIWNPISIKADPISWKIPLKINFEWIWWEIWDVYKWDFWNWDTSSWKTLSYLYDKKWIYEAKLEIFDKDWKKKGENIILINANSIFDEISSTIKPSKIYWTNPLDINFTAFVSWGDWKYTYTWDFWNWDIWNWKSINYIFKDPWVYRVELKIEDDSGNVSYSTVNIKIDKWVDKNLDTDKDWVPDYIDLCPNVLWSSLNNWCPILEDFCWVDCSCGKWFICSSKDKNLCSIKWVCIPDYSLFKSSITSCQQWQGLNNIFWNASCNSCPCDNFLDFNSNIRKCDLILPAITSPDSSKIYSNWETYEIN